jgi:predicted HicB family RNase H-like nuclease
MAGSTSTETGTKVLFVRVDEAFHRELKMSAVASGVTLTGLVESILRQYREQQRTSGVAPTVQLVTAPAQAPAGQS